MKMGLWNLIDEGCATDLSDCAVIDYSMMCKFLDPYVIMCKFLDPYMIMCKFFNPRENLMQS
jgi:hypothetical protein